MAADHSRLRRRASVRLNVDWTASTRSRGARCTPGSTCRAARSTPSLSRARSPKDMLRSIDANAARTAHGVVRVITPDDMPALGSSPVPPAAQSFVPMSDKTIRYEGQPVAIVVAETLEQAEEGAELVAVEIEPAQPTVFETAIAAEPRAQGNGYAFAALALEHGDVDAALAAAAATIDAVYVAPTRHHNMMEPSTTLAEWRGDELHVQDATQWTYGIRYALAGLLRIDPARIHVRCPFTGGGFGAKGYVWPHQILTPIAARLVGRPVKLSIGRSGCYTGTGYQPVVRSRIQLGARRDGMLTAVVHETENVTSSFDDYVEFGSAGSRSMYAADAYRFRTLVRRADVATPTAMRAPHEGPGMFALESAMDELAYELGIDPLELRLASYADTDPHSAKPFSSKKLREAYLEGARRIGWAERKMEPRSRSDGGKLVGLGMASAIMSTFRFACAARAVLKADGPSRHRSRHARDRHRYANRARAGCRRRARARHGPDNRRPGLDCVAANRRHIRLFDDHERRISSRRCGSQSAPPAG